MAITGIEAPETTVAQFTPEAPSLPEPTAPTAYGEISAFDPSKTAGYTPPTAPTLETRAITPDQTVEGRLASLLDKDSPVIKEARLGAMEQAASRGLVNTSIAAGAGERAAIQTAYDIARPDAQTAATSAQSAQEATQLGKLEGMRGEITSELEAQRAAQNIVFEKVMANISPEKQETFAQLSSGIQQKYQDDYIRIQQTPDDVMNRSAKEHAINMLNESTTSQVELLGALYSYDITWTPDGGIDSGVVADSNTGVTLPISNDEEWLNWYDNEANTFQRIANSNDPRLVSRYQQTINNQ